jgi:hypothetical protein
MQSIHPFDGKPKRMKRVAGAWLFSVSVSLWIPQQEKTQRAAFIRQKWHRKMLHQPQPANEGSRHL